MSSGGKLTEEARNKREQRTAEREDTDRALRRRATAAKITAATNNRSCSSSFMGIIVAAARAAVLRCGLNERMKDVAQLATITVNVGACRADESTLIGRVALRARVGGEGAG